MKSTEQVIKMNNDRAKAIERISRQLARREPGDFDYTQFKDSPKEVDGLVKVIMPNEDGTTNIMIRGIKKPFTLPRGAMVRIREEVKMTYLNGPRDPYPVLNVKVYGKDGVREYSDFFEEREGKSEARADKYTGRAA